jgi:peptidoglycan/LPS O-acetylase OafA/YrhL
MRIQYLDGLRGWAALFVLFHHLLLAFAPDGRESALHASPAAAPVGFLADGPLAVAIFFILSGIVLTAAVSHARESGSARGLRPGFAALMLKRWLRLGLPILAAGLLVLGLFALGLDRSNAIGGASDSSFMRGFFAPGYAPTPAGLLRESFLGAFLGPTPPHDPVLWTIRIEFAGSALVFALALPLPAGRARLGAALILGTVLALLPPAWPAWPAPDSSLGWIGNYGALFMLGMALHDWLRLEARRGIRAPAWRDALGLTLILLGLCLYPLFGIRVHDVAATPPAIGDGQAILGGSQLRAALVVAGVLLSPTLQAFLGGALSAFLGRVSFGLYLLHAPLIWSVGGLTYLPLAGMLGHWPAALLASILVTALSLGLSALFHRLVEQPAMRLSAHAASALTALPPLFGRHLRRGIGGNLELAPVATRRNAGHALE